MTRLTAETIGTRQIRDLRTAPAESGDSDQVLWCDVALASHETSDAEGNLLFAPDGSETSRTAARQVCADAINARRAQEPA